MESILKFMDEDYEITHPIQGPMTGSTEIPSMQEVLQKRRCHLMDKIRDIDLTLEALRENPDIAKVLNLVRKCNHH